MYKVMVVDDAPDMFKIIRTILNEDLALNLDLSFYSSGEKAKEMFPQITPDLVITDICMPDVDGYELIRHIKKISNTKILALSAFSYDEFDTGTTLSIAEHMGADYSLCKSKVPEHLSKLVESILLNTPCD